MLSTVKYEFIRTPLERPLMWLRSTLLYREASRYPELREVYLEPGRIGAALKRVMRRSSNCIDIGCHYGSMLSCFCRLAPNGRHLAFEPTPVKVRFLRRKFPDVDVRELALSDRSGTASFYINRSQSGFSGLARHGDGDFEQIDVASARLDDVVPRDRRFDLLKLDVEGAELLVFRGATELLGRDRPTIFFECGPSGPKVFGYKAGEIHELLTGQCRYLVFLPKDFLAGGSPVDRAAFEAALVYPFKALNWIAVPREAAGLNTSKPARSVIERSGCRAKPLR